MQRGGKRMSEVVTGGIGWSPDFGELKPLMVPEAIKLAVTYTLWRAVKAPNGYIDDDELKQCVKNILVTYETPTGQRKVRSIFCDHGRCGKIVNGKVVAWMPLPEPYREVAE